MERTEAQSVNVMYPYIHAHGEALSRLVTAAVAEVIKVTALRSSSP